MPEDHLAYCVVAGMVGGLVAARIQVSGSGDRVHRVLMTTFGAYMGGSIGAFGALGYSSPPLGVAIFGPPVISAVIDAVL